MGGMEPGPPSVLGQFVAEIGRALFAESLEQLMATIDELKEQVLDLKNDTDAMQGRVLAGVSDLKVQIQALKDQLAQAANVPVEITDTLTAIDATVNALDPTKSDVLPSA